MGVSTEATVFFLVRHALCDPVGVTIAGRGGAVPLNEAGRRQASSLAERSEWRRFNQLRSWAQVPDGELMISAQARAVAGLARLRDAHPENRVVIVTHADVIRGVLTHAVGAPLDMLLRFECDAASVSVVTLDNDNVRVLRVNDSGSLAGL